MTCDISAKKSAIYNAIKPLDFQVVVIWLDVPFMVHIMAMDRVEQMGGQL